MEPPDPGPAGYLVGYLFEVGPAAGGEVLTFQELEAWQRSTGQILSAWEAITLRHLSGAFLAEAHEADHEGRLPPGEQERAATRERVGARLEAMFDSLIAQDEQAPQSTRPRRRG